MSDPAGFAEARLAELEVAAKLAQVRFPGPWDRSIALDSPLPSAVSLYDANDESFAVVRGSYAAEHLTHFDPVFTLSLVAALRGILAEHRTRVYEVLSGHPEYGHDYWCDTCSHENAAKGWCRTVLLVASIWATHPDYKESWKP